MIDDVRTIDWSAVWLDVAEQLASHRSAGRQHLLTEDTVRMCSILALQRADLDPAQLAIEVPDPALQGGKLDLVASGPETRAVIELKYPRGSRVGASPDTMTLGELIRDSLRVAVTPATDRWVVTVLGPEIRRYLARLAAPQWKSGVGDHFILDRDELEALPKTAREAIGSLAWALPVQAHCVVATPIDVDLALFAYQVEAPPDDIVTAPLATYAPKVRGFQPRVGSRAAKTGTARSAILDAIRALVARSGNPEVTVQQVVDEMRRIGSDYAESTVRTMLTSHMCAQVHGPNIGTYDDVDRVDRGTYRLRTIGR